MGKEEDNKKDSAKGKSKNAVPPVDATAAKSPLQKPPSSSKVAAAMLEKPSSTIGVPECIFLPGHRANIIETPAATRAGNSPDEKDEDGSDSHPMFQKWLKDESATVEDFSDDSISGDSPHSRNKGGRKWTFVVFIGIFTILCIGVIFAALILLKGTEILFMNQHSSSGSNNDVDSNKLRPGGKGPRRGTERPSSSPTPPRPTLRPSQSPTDAPSYAPTSSPSFEPTSLPSSSPTVSPTKSPTAMPTRPELPDDFKFRFRMHYKPEYNWQEEGDVERQWCLECTRCEDNEISASPAPYHCRDPDNNDGTDCAINDQLWLQNCNGFRGSSGNPYFEIIRHQDADQVKIWNKDLCIERQGPRFLNLKRCDSSNIDQMFIGFDPDRLFDLRPLSLSVDGIDRCWSQHHWPKKYEMLFLEECDLAHTWDTGLWEAI